MSGKFFLNGKDISQKLKTGGPNAFQEALKEQVDEAWAMPAEKSMQLKKDEKEPIGMQVYVNGIKLVIPDAAKKHALGDGHIHIKLVTRGTISHSFSAERAPEPSKANHKGDDSEPKSKKRK